MHFGDIVVSFLLNIIPLIVLLFPIIFLKRKSAKRSFYLRFYYGLCFFFAVYWFLPALLQLEIKSLSIEDLQLKQPSLITLYIVVRFFSLITSYAQYPFILLPLIFVFSPFVSLLILYLRIRKEKKNENLDIFQEIHYEYMTSPKEMIRNALRKNDWSKEKEMFKAFLIIMPIAIYLLAVILDISGLEPVNLNKSTTAIGMLIEIFFVYIATFLYGYQLIKASKLSFRGKFIGEQIEARFFSSLKQVGTPIAILSIILFILQKTDSLLLFIYIFGYFLMAAFIFILFLRIFEPISILILLKIINARKWKQIGKFKHLIQRIKEKRDNSEKDESLDLSLQNVKTTKQQYTQHQSKYLIIIILYGIIAASLSVIVFFIISYIGYLFTPFLPPGSDITVLSAASATPTYLVALITETSVSLHSIELMFRVIILSYFFNYALRTKLHNATVILIYGGTLLALTIVYSILLRSSLIIPLNFAEETSWLTGVPVTIENLSFSFVTVRTGFLTASFSGNMVLRGLTIPFYICSPFSTFILWGYLFCFGNKQFMAKSFDKQHKYVERTTFSIVSSENITDLLTFFNIHPGALIMKKSGQSLSEFEYNLSEWNEIASKLIENGEIKLSEISKSTLTDERFEAWLKHEITLKHISIWIPEFSCIFERAQIDSVYILYQDGRNLFFHRFQTSQTEKEKTKEKFAPSLVSGMFSAITSFVKEVTNSADLLRSIDSGDKKVLLEYSQSLPIFGAIFADRETGQVRRALKDFLTRFGNRHGHILVNWSGDVSIFSGDRDILEESFKEFM